MLLGARPSPMFAIQPQQVITPAGRDGFVCDTLVEDSVRLASVQRLHLNHTILRFTRASLSGEGILSGGLQAKASQLVHRVGADARIDLRCTHTHTAHLIHLYVYARPHQLPCLRHLVSLFSLIDLITRSTGIYILRTRRYCTWSSLPIKSSTTIHCCRDSRPHAACHLPCSMSSSHNPTACILLILDAPVPRRLLRPSPHATTLELVSPHTCHCHEPSMSHPSIPACSISPRSHSLCFRVRASRSVTNDCS